MKSMSNHCTTYTTLLSPQICTSGEADTHSYRERATEREREGGGADRCTEKHIERERERVRERERERESAGRPGTLI